jgi:hypothetical protein
MEQLIESLKSLAQKMLELKTPEDGRVFVEKQCEEKWEFEGFIYSDNGISFSKYYNKETYINNWVKFRIHLHEVLPNLKIYKDCVANISSQFPTFFDPEFAVRGFVDYVYNDYLNKDIDDEYSVFIDEVIERLIRNLKEDPIECTAKVYLLGLILESESIQLSPTITLRQTKKDDLESIMPHPLNPQNAFHILDLTAILEIKLHLQLPDVSSLQIKINQYISILRLFGVGGIRYYINKSDSKSILIKGFPRGYMYTDVNQFIDFKYKVRKDSESKLNKFCSHMEKIMPADLYKLMDKKVDHLTIAFDRYSEGIIEPVILERRILHISMGLEALFSNSETELSFRLTYRISKALSCLGINPLDAKIFIKEAYNIRSKFAHGSPLSLDQHKKLDGIGGEKMFLSTMANYLRILILAAIICKLKKKNLINLIDDSFLDAQKESELKMLLSAALPYI